MDDWFNSFSALRSLSAAAVRELGEVGFIVVPGPAFSGGPDRLAAAHDAAVAAADPDEVRIGSTTTRVSDFVNRGAEFDRLYLFEPLQEASSRTIGPPFRLSTMHSRTVRPFMPAQDLHVDFARDVEGWPMIGFIYMVDEFRHDVGATRFVPGSHQWTETPHDLTIERVNDPDRQVMACGPAGSVVIYNGSIWHAHAANLTYEPRRSIQGAYIRRDASSGVDLPARIRPKTLARIGPLAKYLVAA